MAPSMYTQWTLEAENGIESLVCGQAKFPKEIGENEVLVKLHAASLNYKEVMKTTGDKNIIEQLGVVQGSDGAGTIFSVGKSVTSFVPGDKVVTHMVPNVEPDAFLTFEEISAGYGHAIDGTIREYGVFHESALLHMPKNLSFEQASTLTCSGLTAWNALFGGGRGPKKGDTILTQGTGGVSVAALQFAIASGATVISTTGSEAKAERLLALGASQVINYKTDPQWGTSAKSLSTNGFGISNVIDVGGTATLAESMKAVCTNGTVTVAGVLGDVNAELPSIMDCMWHLCSVRGIFLGTKNQFKDMVKFIEEKGVEPVVDERVFGLHEVKEAYQYLKDQKHFSKVVIKIA